MRVRPSNFKGPDGPKVERSSVFPDLDVQRLVSFLEHPTALQAVKAFREALRR